MHFTLLLYDIFHFLYNYPNHYFLPTYATSFPKKKSADVKALMRIAQVYDIPMAVNKATADFMIKSIYMDTEYDHEVINFNKNVEDRAESM